MISKECIAMLLAGGQGNRLGILTKNIAKPAIPFGGKYRIIDFTLSNCTNSGIDTVGVLTQYRPLKLNAYIGTGQPWDLDRVNGGVYILPPYLKSKRGEWYKGTANAIYQNIEFIEQYNPKYVLILSGDHIYKMDYSSMIRYHKEKNADATIAVINVPIKDASRFGIMNTNDDNKIYEFEEKPKHPKSNKASMGIYVFTWEVLKEYLVKDELNSNSEKDFGKNVIPNMLLDGLNLYAYPFEGYWKDVGTIQSYFEANMDLLETPPVFDLYDPKWRIYGRNPIQPPHFASKNSQIKKSIITEGCTVYGKVYHSVVFYGVHIGENSEVVNSIIMPNVRIGNNTKIYNSIIGEGAVIGDSCQIGVGDIKPNKLAPNIYSSGITVIINEIIIDHETTIGKNVVIGESIKDIKYVESGESITGEED
ncbi:glucose-1-phosphate adenylyltransferase [Caloramator sp. E03]|uniref:glucose-1-phosphate adenylyltransferase n=1 Tax=Caloramator sp. E03 TaxID=2576307 RepID=UPI00111053DC|nr:glucose-1-phosphate adenylyltransferase [Caloramator sp. E03]QCX33359.1 glucose-1-phosphate adenylyltransferase [Caloramator sp. E03]